MYKWVVYMFSIVEGIAVYQGIEIPWVSVVYSAWLCIIMCGVYVQRFYCVLAYCISCACIYLYTVL